MASISVSTGYLEAIAKLPKSVQKKAIEFTEKFRQDPRSPGINYETIKDSRDPNLRSCRIDQAYRAIVLKPSVGDSFLLLWVDAHDDAYAWASKRSVQVNPATGSLQVVVSNESANEVLNEVAATEVPTVLTDFPLGDLTDEQALSLGVPADNLPLIRLIRTEVDLVRLATFLPQEAYEALELIASGEPIAEVLGAYAVQPPKQPQTVEEALLNLDSMRRFVTITDEDQLRQMLDAPLAQWRTFLHPSQRKLVEMKAKGPVKVLGGPGTGKTIVALHRACHLARLSPSSQVFLTTKTRNLAADLSSLKSSLDPKLKNIVVQNIDSYTLKLLKESGVDASPATDHEQSDFWNRALAAEESSITIELVKAELYDIIQPQQIMTVEEYIRTPRTGMKGRLDRVARIAVWRVVEKYLSICRDEKRFDWLTLTDMARVSAGQVEPRFAHVIVDESQDFHPTEWGLVRALVAPSSNDIFLVGDAHQRIYGRKFVLSRLGIDTRGRSKRLKLNYRTTHEIKNWAIAMYDGITVDDLDESGDDLRGYVSLVVGEKPEVHGFDSEEAEREFLTKLARNLADSFRANSRDIEGICFAARSQQIIDGRIAPALRASGIPFTQLTNTGRPDSNEICVGNFHRVKGTEFPVMILVGIEDGSVPLSSSGGSTSATVRERSLLFVAATRAREGLVVTYVGDASNFLPG